MYIESKISDALINNQISHEDFITIINEGRNYRKLKEKFKKLIKALNFTTLILRNGWKIIT